jgi:hypothetical protein
LIHLRSACDGPQDRNLVVAVPLGRTGPSGLLPCVRERGGNASGRIIR